MRKKVNIPIAFSDLDYGKKPYVSPIAYQGQARKATSKLEHDNVVRQYSEFKRPQGRWEGYQEMEYWADNPPGIVFPDFTVPDMPGTEFPVPDFSWGETVSFVCFCGADKCYCPGQTICFDPLCTYPIVGASIDGIMGAFTITKQKSRICITASEDAVGPVEVALTLLKLKPDGKGGVTKEGTCVVGKIYDKCRDDECCAGTEDMAWDEATSAENVGQNSNCIVAITDNGDGAPYTWSVSGTGFWFNAGHSITLMQTKNKVVALYTDGDACGTATITVAGCGKSAVTGYVKSTAGTSIEISRCTRSAGSEACIADCSTAYYEFTSLNGLLYQVFGQCIRSDRCYTCKGDYVWLSGPTCLTPGADPPITWDCVGHDHCASCPGEVFRDVGYSVTQWICN